MLENTIVASVYVNIISCSSFLRNIHSRVGILDKLCIASVRAIFQKNLSHNYPSKLSLNTIIDFKTNSHNTGGSML